MIRRTFALLIFASSICHAQSVTVDVPPHTDVHVTVESESNKIDTSPCALFAADVRIFANDFQQGASLAAELKKYGNHDFRISAIKQVFRFMKIPGATPAKIQQAAFEQCSQSSN
ncbi:hypothetical protein [Burkholderia vietnamiensis]|uniref:hypothetical protein n=1 Tax=Burkholderia vietnamiensis TaxID=60552 RepID=UPI001B96E494|nr:hypothetical protein [Burkholderia vietnamiensis]MBR8147078.1 hypothetical protein [Burkholderia vietnamiensis]